MLIPSLPLPTLLGLGGAWSLVRAARPGLTSSNLGSCGLARTETLIPTPYVCATLPGAAAAAVRARDTTNPSPPTSLSAAAAGFARGASSAPCHAQTSLRSSSSPKRLPVDSSMRDSVARSTRLGMRTVAVASSPLSLTSERVDARDEPEPEVERCRMRARSTALCRARRAARGAGSGAVVEARCRGEGCSAKGKPSGAEEEEEVDGEGEVRPRGNAGRGGGVTAR